jgi:biopolymer transport protein ExbD
MAFKPSMRRLSQSLEMDLDIRPVMNLMVVLIPLLLAGTEMVRLSIIEINLPPTQAGGGGSSDEVQKPEKEQEQRLGLKIAITKSGFSIASASAVLAGEEGEGPTVPVNENGDYDFKKLREKLIEIKKAVKNKDFKDKDSAIITASADIKYQIIIDVLDAIYSYIDDERNVRPLFPQINFGQVL